MAIVTTDDKHYRDIAEALRIPVGATDKIKPEEMAERIGKVGEQLYHMGESTGYGIGYNDGKDEGVEEGAKAEYDRFWDAFQENGNRTNYRYAFYGSSWNDSAFTPKYPIKCSGVAQDAFYTSCITDTKVDIYFLAGVTTSRTFATGTLKTIRRLVVDESVVFTNTFLNATALETLYVDGIIGQNGFNVQYATRLSRDSIVSIINALSSTTSGLTVTFSKTAVNKAFEQLAGANDGANGAEWQDLIATRPNWTISLV